MFIPAGYDVTISRVVEEDGHMTQGDFVSRFDIPKRIGILISVADIADSRGIYWAKVVWLDDDSTVTLVPVNRLSLA